MSQNTSKLMFQKKTVSLVGKMETWYFFGQLKEKSELAFFRCLCTCSVNVQTWKLIFMFAFVSTLFSNTTNVTITQLRQPYTKDSLWCSWTWSNALVATLLEKRLSDKLYIRIPWFYSSFLMIMRRPWQTSLNIFGKKVSSLVGHISYQEVFYIIFTNLYKIRHGQMFSKIEFYTRKKYTQKPSPTHSKII